MIVVNGVEGAREVADSGADEVSEIRGESKVEFVVVGDDSVDSDCVDNDVILPRWPFGLECGSCACKLAVWAVIRKPSGSTLLCSLRSPALKKPDSSPPPKTDMKDGNDPDIIWSRSASILVALEEDERRFEGE